MNRFVTSTWTFTDSDDTQVSVVVNFDKLTDKVVANAVGPGRVGLVVGRLERQSYVNGNGNTSTKYRVLVNDGTALDWDRTRTDALDRAGTAAIQRAKS